MTWINEKARPLRRAPGARTGRDDPMQLDVEQPGAHGSVFDAIRERWGRLDFLLHSIAFAPSSDLHGRVADTTREGFARAMDISCHSFMRMARLAEPLMDKGGTLLTMTYLGADEVVPRYGVMGPVKAALEASVRYLATELGPRGIRVNAVSPGPIRTRAASGIREFDELVAEARRRCAAGARGRDRRRRRALRVPRERRRAGHHRRRALRRRRLPHPRLKATLGSARHPFTTRHRLRCIDNRTLMTSTFARDDLEVIRNRTFDEIAVGDRASIERTLTAADIQLFAAMSGDVNPQHIDAEFAASTRFHGVIAHGMWGAALISAVLGTRLPGPGTRLRAARRCEFHAPVHVGDTLTIAVTRHLAGRSDASAWCWTASCANQDGKTVISGEAHGACADRAHRAAARHVAAGAHRRCRRATTWCGCCSTCGRWGDSRWRWFTPATRSACLPRSTRMRPG